MSTYSFITNAGTPASGSVPVSNIAYYDEFRVLFSDNSKFGTVKFTAPSVTPDLANGVVHFEMDANQVDSLKDGYFKLIARKGTGWSDTTTRTLVTGGIDYVPGAASAAPQASASAGVFETKVLTVNHDFAPGEPFMTEINWTSDIERPNLTAISLVPFDNYYPQLTFEIVDTAGLDNHGAYVNITADWDIPAWNSFILFVTG